MVNRLEAESLPSLIRTVVPLHPRKCRLERGIGRKRERGRDYKTPDQQMKEIDPERIHFKFFKI